MVRFTVTGSIDPLLAADLEDGDSILAESNAMVAMDANLSLSGRSRGGIFKSLARKILNDETFFQQKISAENGAGQVLLTPRPPGDVVVLDVGERQYMLSDGSFLACTDSVDMEVKSQGIGRAMLGDSGGLFVMKTNGNGLVAVSGFGSMRTVTVTDDKPLMVDNGHLVAWDADLDYELALNTSHSGFFGKLVNSQTSGEGIVLKFTGNGKVLVCSRNKGGLLDWIFSNMPSQKAVTNE